MSDPVLEAGAAPETHHLSFLALLFGATAAPIFWLGQVMLGYGLTAYACYPGDHPVMISGGAALRSLLLGFDVIAVVAALAGGMVAWRCLRRVQQHAVPPQRLGISAGRARFLALWGVFSSLCFLCAILFNILASVTVPLCLS